MADNNPNVEASTLNDLKPKKHGGSWNRMPITKLKVDLNLNIRFKKGQTTFGVTVDADTYDLPTMKLQIIDGGGIQEPIVVSEQADGSLIVLRGNRRTLAGLELDSDPATPANVKEALQSVPVQVYKHLTRDQEMELVEDQGQKPFLRSETVQHVWRLQARNWGFERIAMQLVEVFGKFSGNHRKMAEIRAIPAEDVNGRRTAVKKWLRGTLDEYIMPAYKLGPRVMKACLLSEMALDGVLPTTAEKPEWITTKDPQKRMAALEKAKKADGSNFNPHTGGPEFNKVIVGFRAIDYPDPTKINPDANTTKKRLSVAELKTRQENSRSTVAKMAFSIAQGEVEDRFQVRDDFLSLVEAKEGLAMQYLPSIKADTMVSLADAIRAFIVSESAVDFEAWLAKHAEALSTEKPADVPKEETENDNLTSLTDEEDEEDTNNGPVG